VGRRPKRDAVISLVVPAYGSRLGGDASARVESGDFAAPLGDGAFGYADLGDGPGDGVRIPPLGSLGGRPFVGEGWSREDRSGVGARNIPCLLGEAERNPAV